MIGKAVKNVSSAATRAAQSAPKPAPKPAYKLPPVRLPAVKSAPPTPTSPRQRFGGLGAGFRGEFGAGTLKKGGSVSSKRAVKVKPKGRKS